MDSSLSSEISLKWSPPKSPMQDNFGEDLQQGNVIESGIQRTSTDGDGQSISNGRYPTKWGSWQIDNPPVGKTDTIGLSPETEIAREHLRRAFAAGQRI